MTTVIVKDVLAEDVGPSIKLGIAALTEGFCVNQSGHNGAPVVLDEPGEALRLAMTVSAPNATVGYCPVCLISYFLTDTHLAIVGVLSGDRVVIVRYPRPQ